MEKDTYLLLKNIYQDDLYIIDSVESDVIAEAANVAQEAAAPVHVEKQPKVAEVQEPTPTFDHFPSEDNTQTETYYTLVVTKGTPDPEEHVLLTNILSASKRKMNEVKIVSDALSDQEIEKLTEAKSLKYVICFGTRQISCIPKAPLNYQIIEIKEIKYTLAHPLSAINVDKNKKGNLWDILQTMFGLK